MASTPTAVPSELDPAALGDRVLIVASHPDDEVLVAGGTMHALRSAGARVRVVLLTAGDGYLRAARRLGRFSPDEAAYRHLGEVRFQESVDAGGVLGVPPADVLCLGYPDGCLTSMLEANRESSSATAGRAGSEVVPYGWAFRPGAACAGDEVARDLVTIVREYGATTVIYPDARDTHDDHAAAARLTADALEACRFDGTRLTCLVHFGHYPYPWAYRPADAMRPPRALRDAGVEWASVLLAPADLAAKEAALRAFTSQNAIPDLRYYLRAFVRSNELFAIASR